MMTPDAARYLLGHNFGWSELMNAARDRARQTGRRQKVRPDGPTWRAVSAGTAADTEATMRSEDRGAWYWPVPRHVESEVAYEQVYQAWHNTTEAWGGCADREAIARVLTLFGGRA